jgi:hypothetical protein
MKGKVKTKNIIAFWCAFFSSIFLFISGTTGVEGLRRVEEIVLRFVEFSFVKIIFILLIIVASFGGIAVLIGGILILQRKIFWGRLLISIGAGAGVIGFLFNLFISIVTSTFSLNSYLSYSSIGVVFAFLAQIISGKTRKRRKRKQRYSSRRK